MSEVTMESPILSEATEPIDIRVERVVCASRAETIAIELESYIRDRFAVRPDDLLFSRHVNLWDEGYVDSTGLVEVIAFLESTFDAVLPDEALFSPEFRTITGIAALVAQLKE
jgi:acyl carrier protein